MFKYSHNQRNREELTLEEAGGGGGGGGGGVTENVTLLKTWIRPSACGSQGKFSRMPDSTSLL